MRNGLQPPQWPRPPVVRDRSCSRSEKDTVRTQSAPFRPTSCAGNTGTIGDAPARAREQTLGPVRRTLGPVRPRDRADRQRNLRGFVHRGPFCKYPALGSQRLQVTAGSFLGVRSGLIMSAWLRRRERQVPSYRTAADGHSEAASESSRRGVIPEPCNRSSTGRGSLATPGSTVCGISAAGSIAPLGSAENVQSAAERAEKRWFSGILLLSGVFMDLASFQREILSPSLTPRVIISRRVRGSVRKSARDHWRSTSGPLKESGPGQIGQAWPSQKQESPSRPVGIAVPLTWVRRGTGTWIARGAAVEGGGQLPKDRSFGQNMPWQPDLSRSEFEAILVPANRRQPWPLPIELPLTRSKEFLCRVKPLAVPFCKPAR